MNKVMLYLLSLAHSPHSAGQHLLLMAARCSIYEGPSDGHLGSALLNFYAHPYTQILGGACPSDECLQATLLSCRVAPMFLWK